METSIERVVFYRDANSSLEYELYGNTAVLHSEIANWKLSVFKHSLRVFNTLLTYFRSQGLSYVMTVTPNPKFSKLFGGYTTYKFTHENKEYEVVRWDLK